jgi:cobalt-zinc-cadmium efflux system outer membrane protein
MAFLLCCLLLLVASTAHAQGGPAQLLTLQDALNRAFMNNPTIAAERLRGPIDAAGLALARERPNPEASVEFEKETPKQSFGVSVPVELGRKRDKRMAIGQATIREGEAELAAVMAGVRTDVRRAYFGATVAVARTALMVELRDLSTRVRDSAQQRFDAGGAPRLEVMQAMLALASAENEVTAAQGAENAARTALNALIGLPLETPVQLTTAIDAGSPMAREAALDLAHRVNTNVAVFDRQIDAQRARIALAGALRVPDLVPTASVTRDAAPEFDVGWRAGVALVVPIFTTHRAGVAIEQAGLDQLVAERRALLVQIDAAVSAAAILADARRQQYLRYRDDIVPQAQQVEQVAQDSYQLGQTGLVALLQALQASRDVRLRSLDAAEEFQSALADLERAIGAPLP